MGFVVTPAPYRKKRPRKGQEKAKKKKALFLAFLVCPFGHLSFCPPPLLKKARKRPRGPLMAFLFLALSWPFLGLFFSYGEGVSSLDLGSVFLVILHLDLEVEL